MIIIMTKIYLFINITKATNLYTKNYKVFDVIYIFVY